MKDITKMSQKEFIKYCLEPRDLFSELHELMAMGNQDIRKHQVIADLLHKEGLRLLRDLEVAKKSVKHYESMDELGKGNNVLLSDWKKKYKVFNDEVNFIKKCIQDHHSDFDKVLKNIES